MQSSGFEGQCQLNVVNWIWGPLERGKARFLEELDHEMLDFVLCYYIDIAFCDSVQFKACFSINKGRSLQPEICRFCPALQKDAYHFPLKPLVGRR
jgi:hypothetical protein